MNLKEIHAYLNEDGTYRLEALTDVIDVYGNAIPAKVTSQRAVLKVSVLHDGYSITTEDKQNDVQMEEIHF